MLLKNRKEPDQEEKQPEPLFKAPGIAKQLANAESTLAGLMALHGDAALDNVLTGSNERLAPLEGELTAARRRVETLRAAHQAALAIDEKERRVQIVAQQKTQIRAARSHLAARDAAAEAMSVALTEATKQFRILVERSAKAKAAFPAVGAWPSGHTSCEFHEIRTLVEKELYRLGGDPSLGNKHSFPGGAVHGELIMLGQPEKIAPIADKLKQASEYVLNTLTGKVVEQ